MTCEKKTMQGRLWGGRLEGVLAVTKEHNFWSKEKD